MKNLLSFTLLFILLITSQAQLKTPDQYLEYPLGSRYTDHYHIVEYFKYVAETKPQMVKLVKYGETYEHRPLYATFVSSPANISNLEKIRQNNLALAHQNNVPASEDTPVIIWLSYNVHGNETSSSEAAMKTLYSLLTDHEDLLKNTVVVIDPALNPDGRDRFVNWYNMVLGKNYDPYQMAREHQEPWPRGRSNHYNHDLNRDWLWQTQIESQQRVALYNQWLPQVHIDFHEQSYNAPYFFPPAAEPYHEVITQWQRDYQKIAGKNNAKYFDKNGWLYFTNHRFDLFYPSYGDTYPIYNGSIGMTYEQGGISAGLGVITNNKDTLTLADRILHHYTSSISNVETASQNAKRLIHEFHQYFNNAVDGKIGTYKSYVIKYKPEDEQRIKAMMQLLDRIGVQYGNSRGSARGFNYFTQKEESFTIGNQDLVIPSTQPKSDLVKVILEPKSKLSDSITYDVTAWALPYVYGLTAFASKQPLKVSYGNPLPPFENNVASNVYGYALPWTGLESVKVAGALLEKRFRIRYSDIPFETGGDKFGRGTIVITKDGNAKFGSRIWDEVAEICNRFQLKLYPLETGMMDKGGDLGGDRMHIMRPVKVAILTGEGVGAYSAGEIWDYFDNEISYPSVLINAKDFNRIKLSDFDVLILPDGDYDFLNNKTSAAGLESWIRAGGKLIAFEDAAKQVSKQAWSVFKLKSPAPTDSLQKDQKVTKETEVNRYAAIKVYENRERDEIEKEVPGAIFKVDLDNTHPLAFGYPDYYYTLKLSPDIYEFATEKGWNVGVLKTHDLVSGFVGSKLKPKLTDGVLFGVQDLGRGHVVLFADNVIFRSFWEEGKLMLANAVFMMED